MPRPDRDLPRLRGTVSLILALLAALVFLVACTAGNEAQPSSTSTPRDEPRRWGYNPHKGTGREDPPLLFNPLPPNYRIETVVTGLDRPTQLAVTPDGRILVAEQPGTVRIVEAHHNFERKSGFPPLDR